MNTDPGTFGRDASAATRRALNVLRVGAPSPYPRLGEGAIFNVDKESIEILIGLPNATSAELNALRQGRLEMRLLDFGSDGGIAVVIIRVLDADGSLLVSFDCTYHAARVPPDRRGIPSSEPQRVSLAHMVATDERNIIIALRAFTFPQAVHVGLEAIIDAQLRAYPDGLDDETHTAMGNAIYARYSASALMDLPPLATGFSGASPVSGRQQ